MPNTLGVETKTTILKHESHKLHHEFQVKDTEGTITFDADLIAANQVDGEIDSVAIAPVVFDTDHDTTMDNLLAEIQAHPAVETATLTDATNNRQITINPVDKSRAPSLTNWAVTLGAGQAGTVTATEFNKVWVGTPVELTSEGEVRPLSGDADHDMIGYAYHTSTGGELVTVVMRAALIIFGVADGALTPGPVKWEKFETATGYNQFNDTGITAVNFTGWALDEAFAALDVIRVATRS